MQTPEIINKRIAFDIVCTGVVIYRMVKQIAENSQPLIFYNGNFYTDAEFKKLNISNAK